MLRAGGADGDRGAGSRRELDANEQIGHYSCSSGEKHISWPPRQSFLGSKTGRDSLNTTSPAQRAEMVCQEHSPVLTRTSAKPLKVGPTARCMISEAKGKFHRPQIFSDGSGMILTEACRWEEGIGTVSSFRWADPSSLSSSVTLASHLNLPTL